MNHKIAFIAFLGAFLGFFSQLYPADTVYTTSLNLRKTGNRILLEWRANTNKMTFLIFRSPSIPIANPTAMSNSQKLGSVLLEGIRDKDLYNFPPYIDNVNEDGKYYYLVIPDNKRITAEDFYPNLNYNISPITFKKDEAVAAIDEQGPMVIEEADEIQETEPVVETASEFVKSIFIKTNIGAFQVFWDMDHAGSAPVQFTVYRTAYPVTNAFDLNRIQPLKKLQDEYFLEDASVQNGVTYFYTIIVNDYKILMPGKNQNLIPAFIGNTNPADIRVEREVLRKVRVNTRSFNERFKK